MYRNTYLLVSILAVVAALVVGVNVGKKITPQQAPTPTPAPTPTSEKTTEIFTSALCGFSLEYPKTFTLMEGASGSAIINHPEDKAQSIVATCQKDIPGIPLPPEKIESFFVPTSVGASVSAKLYHDASAKDGTPIDVLLFTHPTSGLDIFIAGFGPAFDAAIKTLRILQ